MMPFQEQTPRTIGRVAARSLDVREEILGIFPELLLLAEIEECLRAVTAGVAVTVVVAAIAALPRQGPKGPRGKGARR
jgi:hypothetical protein